MKGNRANLSVRDFSGLHHMRSRASRRDMATNAVMTALGVMLVGVFFCLAYAAVWLITHGSEAVTSFFSTLNASVRPARGPIVTLAEWLFV